VAVDASIAQVQPAGAVGGQAEATDFEDVLFGAVREHAESMISWARSGEALALEHDQLEEKTLADGFELMRVLTEAHMALRAARERRRRDVTDGGGVARNRRGRAYVHQGSSGR
jgi:hypothetical protein